MPSSLSLSFCIPFFDNDWNTESSLDFFRLKIHVETAPYLHQLGQFRAVDFFSSFCPMHGSLRWTSITGNLKLIAVLPLVRINNVVISLLMWVSLCLSHFWKLFFLPWDISKIRCVYGCIVSSACFEIDMRCWLQQISMYVSCGWFPGNGRRGECLFTESVEFHRWVEHITWSWSLLFM